MSATRRVLSRVQNKAPAAYAAAPGTPWAGMGTPTADGLQAFGAVSTLFSLVHRLTTAVAAVDWRMYRTTANPRPGIYHGEADRQEVLAHPALDVWNNPNPHMSRQELVETYLQHAELAGDGFLVIEFNPFAQSLPLELWPVRPDRMKPVPSVEDFLTGWVLTDAAGQQVPFPAAEILQMKYGPHPTDPYRGMGPVGSLLNVISSTQAAQLWNALFFRNNATPRGMWSIEDSVDDDEFREFQARLREQHQGVQNAHRDIVVDNGAKYTAIQVSAKDMQLVETFGVNRDVILEAYGMSKTMIGASESETNRATAETAEYIFAKYQLVERLERIKLILNQRFLPLFGTAARGVEFDYDNPVPEDKEAERADRESRVQSAVALVDAGWAPEEALKCMGLPPMTWVGPQNPANRPQEAMA